MSPAPAEKMSVPNPGAAVEIAVEIAVDLRAGDWADEVADIGALVESAARAALAAAARLERTGRPAELSLVLADDSFVHMLNKAYRGLDSATNVLSFPLDADGPEDAPEMLGDVILAFETVRREAIEQEKTLPNHICHLIVHGVLHLLGYDHMNDQDAERMEALERFCLAGLGIADPYAMPAEVE